MNYEQKYKEALERARKLQKTCDSQAVVGWCEYLFPELQETEDERIRKVLLESFEYQIKESRPDKEWICGVKLKEIVAWLEKQKTSEEAIQYLKENHSPSEISDFQAAMNIAVAKAYDKGMKDGLEKKDEQKSLYIRFGDIPSNEKSKIYRGEKEIGEENGVSVYHAFEVNGNIVLGLTLPITKTTLHTQQHLLEYDDRSSYLVKGDYVGKDTDGQPLINNVRIIEKIEDYRVKEKKQDEQRVEEAMRELEEKSKAYMEAHKGESVDEFMAMCRGEQKPTDKAEPKFRNGQWIVWQDKCYKVNYNGCGYELVDQNGLITSLEYGTVEGSAHLWDITKDAKDGDVLCASSFSSDCIFIFDRLDKWKFDEPNGERAVATGYCCLALSAANVEFGIQGPDCIDVDTVKPATKIGRDLLFQKMKEAGYEWDSEKKELKKLSQQEVTKISDRVKDSAWSEEDENLINYILTNCMYYAEQTGYVKEKQNHYIHQKAKEWLRSLQPKQGWSEEDEKILKLVIARLHSHPNVELEEFSKEYDWLKSLKQTKNRRIKL